MTNSINDDNVEQLQQQRQQQGQLRILYETPLPRRIYRVTEGIGSKKTAIVYQRSFNRFLNHIKLHDLQVLLDYSSKNRPHQIIKEIIIDYILYLRDERKITRSSIKVHLAAILHFFQINNDDFNLTIRSFRFHLPSDESTNDDRPYTIEEIAQVLQGCDLRCKLIILLLCSSGMRMGALHSLQIGDLTPMSFQHWNLYKIQVYARTRDKYFTFCTPECHDAIEDYLSYRRRYGEKLTDKSPLIREQFNTENPFTINSAKAVSEKGIEYIIDNILKKSGVRKPREVHLSHGFRKFFMTQCESSPMKSVHVDMLIGHDIGVKKHYYKSKESVVIEDYITHAADALTVNPEFRLKKKVDELETETAEEIARLREEIERNRKATEHALAMVEAVKGALAAKSEAANASMKDLLGWKF